MPKISVAPAVATTNTQVKVEPAFGLSRGAKLQFTSPDGKLQMIVDKSMLPKDMFDEHDVGIISVTLFKVSLVETTEQPIIGAN